MDCAVHDFKKTLGLKEASSSQQCHFLLFFCPIISRAGTDIEAAVQYLNQVKASSYLSSLPVVMVVLHHTLDAEKPILDSNRVITSEDISAVDCLFNDNGLLTCQKNSNAISKIAKDLKSEKRTLYYCLKKDHENLHPPRDAENELLIPERPVPHPVQRRAISFCGLCDLSVNTIVVIVVAVVFVLIVLALIVIIYNKK
uniref:Si:dkey-58f10.14 n=1 Tax=Sinocyclocheilus rhinocerous TaxID=307959 RepID=A0A673FSX0_9TELE